MPNQNSVSKEKLADIQMELIFTWKTIKEIAKLYRLNKRTVQRLVTKKLGIINLRNWRSEFYR